MSSAVMHKEQLAYIYGRIKHGLDTEMIWSTATDVANFFSIVYSTRLWMMVKKWKLIDIA